MRSFTRTRGRVFWLVCALCVLLPGIAAAGSSSSAIDSVKGARAGGARHARVNAPQAGLKTRLHAESHRHADSADADSESGERATTCALLAVLRVSPRAPRLEDIGARIDRGTRASRPFPLVSRVAPRPPPAPLPLYFRPFDERAFITLRRDRVAALCGGCVSRDGAYANRARGYQGWRRPR